MNRTTPNPARLAGTLADLERELFREDEAFRLEWVERKAAEMATELAHLTRQMRHEAGLSQAQLAAKLGITQPVVARLESRDPQRLPTLDTVAKVAAACGRRMVIHFEPAFGEDHEMHAGG